MDIEFDPAKDAAKDAANIAVHVVRGERVRFISVRKSNDGEQKAYDRA